MIVPQFWAEGRLRERHRGRQVTVRRWGWSDQSPEEAQAHADARTREALDRIRNGEALPRREGRVAYNGADGVPIREEILSRHGETLVTRNAYGAHCLNSPDVLFAEVLPGLKQIVRAAEQRNVRWRRRPTAGDRNNVLIFESQRRTAAPPSLADIGAASAFALVDLAAHGRWDAAAVGGWVHRCRRLARSLRAAIAPLLEHFAL